MKETVERLRYIIKRELNSKTEVVRSDQGGEYLSYGLDELLDEVGAKHETSASGVSQQNGTAEKCIQDLMNDVRTVLLDSGLPLGFWGEALNYCTFTKNRRPCYSNPDNISPYEARYETIAEYKRMQPFGQACAAMYPKKKAPNGKIGPQAMKGIMVGYDDADGTKAYRIRVVYVPSFRKIVITPDVTFMDFKVKTGKIPDVSALTESLYGNTKEEESAESISDRTEQHKQEKHVTFKKETITINESSPETQPLEHDDTKVEETSIDEQRKSAEIEERSHAEETKTSETTNVISEPRRSSRQTTPQDYTNPKRWYSQMLELINCKNEFEVYAANLHGRENTRYTSIYTPKDHPDAMKTSDKSLWLKSEKEENDSIKENKVIIINNN